MQNNVEYKNAPIFLIILKRILSLNILPKSSKDDK